VNSAVRYQTFRMLIIVCVYSFLFHFVTSCANNNILSNYFLIQLLFLFNSIIGFLIGEAIVQGQNRTLTQHAEAIAEIHITTHKHM
jgi:hypothetical protein